MNYDFPESVSQRSDGAQDAENSRIEEITDELRRRCELYEAQCRDSQSHVSPFEIEQRITEAFAKEHGLWIPMDNVLDLGTPGPSGNENDTYVSDNTIFKVINRLMRRPAGTLANIRVRCTQKQILSIGLRPSPKP